MRWNRFGISIFLLVQTVVAFGQDSIEVVNGRSSESHQACLDGRVVTDEDGVNQESATYRHHVELRKRHWAQLIPNQFVIQNAGNMGVLSAGFGWGYGRQHWETHLLWGYIPKHQSTRGKLTMTLKENYIPWNLPITGPHDASATARKRGWTLSPLTASLYVNTVYGHEFWKSQPNRYPDKYYEFMSTKFRLNVALGQRITWEIPSNRRKYAKSITLFYEVSSCDLYIRAKFQDSSVPLKDILGLSIGVKLQTL